MINLMLEHLLTASQDEIPTCELTHFDLSYFSDFQLGEFMTKIRQAFAHYLTPGAHRLQSAASWSIASYSPFAETCTTSSTSSHKATSVSFILHNRSSLISPIPIRSMISRC